MAKKVRKAQGQTASATAKEKQPAKTTGNAAPLEFGDWCFIGTACYQDLWEREKLWLLDYELAREFVLHGQQNQSTMQWKQVFGDLFPGTPFLSLNKKARRGLTQEAFGQPANKLFSSLGSQEGTPSAIKSAKRRIPLFDVTESLRAIDWHLEPFSLTDQYQARLEALVEEVEGKQRQELLRSRQALAKAVADFMVNLPPEAHDASMAHVHMTIRFDYSNNMLKAAFMEMLESIRVTKPRRSSKNEIKAKLKQLAATRLYWKFGTVAKAQSYLAKQDFAPPYKNDSGWTQARREVEKMLGLQRQEA